VRTRNAALHNTSIHRATGRHKRAPVSDEEPGAQWCRGASGYRTLDGLDTKLMLLIGVIVLPLISSTLHKVPGWFGTL
jgi:hypothetical protein